VLTVMLESVDEYYRDHESLFLTLEWGFTIIFTIEYIVRLWVVRDRGKYATSFFGMVDLVSILPTYVELFFPGSHYLMVVRGLRLLRMFRVLKMAHHLGEANVLLNALRAARPKIMVFLFSILALVCLEGTIMYLLEQSANEGFSNIPQSVYWAIVTITTVGYGDIAPVTVAGKVMASIIMVTGFSIIAVPTGIVTSEIGRRSGLGAVEPSGQSRRCAECGTTRHLAGARHCHQCGGRLE
jgi:voltage-gated potassium channel